MAFCDLSQAKVKDNLNKWAGRGTVDRESTKKTYCSAEPRTGGERKGDCNSKKKLEA